MSSKFLIFFISMMRTCKTMLEKYHWSKSDSSEIFFWVKKPCFCPMNIWHICARKIVSSNYLKPCRFKPFVIENLNADLCFLGQQVSGNKKNPIFCLIIEIFLWGFWPLLGRSDHWRFCQCSRGGHVPPTFWTGGDSPPHVLNT